jgi:NADH-quinone oxidoreductase subunit L
MLGLIWLIPALPLAGFLIQVLAGPRLPRNIIALIGVGSVGMAAILATIIGAGFIISPPPGYAYSQTLWVWMRIGNFAPKIAFYLDALSLVMVLVVVWVGFLIHLYSAESMAEGEGYNRFFAYMNLFVSSMLILLLADNLLFLYLGWEGVGLCSYLLIGFWYKDPANGKAARKAFVVTRIGDTAMAIGLFLLFTNLGTLSIQTLMHQAVQQWPVGSPLAIAAAVLLLGGALGKSAQLPLQTWLPDAMAGPTPVSALIHAATMVTAGVYLIARTNVLFTLAPAVQLAVAWIGAATLILAGFSALTQWDIKRVLAYSTISQIGYMFLALGVGAWSAAIFHFMTHAFFKALLFLGAGVVIAALDDEHNMFKMGGLRQHLPLTFWTFLIGAASLSALPLVTAGFYSKDNILWQVWSSPDGSTWLWAAGLAGAVLTSIYSFRMVFLTFFGAMKQPPKKKPGIRIQIPLVVLAVLSLIGGFVELPRWTANLPQLSSFLETALPATIAIRGGPGVEILFTVIASAVSISGIVIAYLLFLRCPQISANLASSPIGATLHRFWLAGWGFDWIYDRLIVMPYNRIAQINKNDVVDLIYQGVARLSRAFYQFLSLTENGNVCWYAMGIAVGALLVVLIVVFL